MGDMADYALDVMMDCDEEQQRLLDIPFDMMTDSEREVMFDYDGSVNRLVFSGIGNTMAKTTKVRRRSPSKSKPGSNGSTDLDALSLPGEDDLNVPPDDFHKYATCIFGEKGVGKTSLAAEFEGYVVLQGEPRRRNLKIRQQAIPVKTLKEIKKESRGDDNYITPWLMYQRYFQLALTDDTVKGLAVDTADRMYDACVVHHCWMLGINDPSDMNDYGATWAAIKNDFSSTLNSYLYDEQEKGLLVISHAHYREVESRDGEANYQLLIPTCAKGAYEWIKQACDFAFYYGYYKKQRALYLRGNDLVWSACGSPDNFLDPSGEPLQVIAMGTNPKQAHDNILAAFNNQIENLKIDSEDDDEEEEERPRRRRRK